jgi:hypothetical protein
MADKNVALEQGQSMLLLLQAYRAEFGANFPHLRPLNRLSSERMIA